MSASTASTSTIRDLARALTEEAIPSVRDLLLDGVVGEEVKKTILAEVRRRFRIQAPVKIDLRINGETKASTGGGAGEYYHKRFEDIVKLVEIGQPVFMVGPAGSGKTHLAGQVARSLGLEFRFQSMYLGMPESQLLGMLIPGEGGAFAYCPSQYVMSYKYGGAHLFDEWDSADANTATIINASIANGKLSVPFNFAEPVVNRHENFRIMAAGNTMGHGADRNYAARTHMDAATMDRFRCGVIQVDYDQDLERGMGDDAVVTWAHAIRDVIKGNGMHHVMSTRTIINMSEIKRRLEFGLGMLNTMYFADWTEDERLQVKNSHPELFEEGGI